MRRLCNNNFLSLKNRLEIVSGFFPTYVYKETIVYHLGDVPSFFFIIQSGKVILKTQNKKIFILERGDSFGRCALSKNSLREEDVEVLEDAELLCLQGDYYKDICNNFEFKDMHEKLKSLMLVPSLCTLNDKLLKLMCSKIKKVKYTDDILTENTKVAKIYMIIEGTVIRIRNGQKPKVLTVGDYFGDIGLFIDKDTYFTYSTTKEGVTVYEIKYKHIEKILGDSYRERLISNNFTQAIGKSEKLSEYIQSENIMEFLKLYKIKYYLPGDIVISTNAKKDRRKIYIVLCGKLVQNKNVIANTIELFGENVTNSEK